MNNHPSIKKQFFHSIKRGTGEAHLLMKKNPQLDFTNYIIKAALNDYAYHSQVEGNRAWYISELIAFSSQEERIRKVILKALQTERKDTWILDQLFELAAIFALKGDNEAHKSIYKRFYKKRILYSDWCGASAILQLDGMAGLKYIASVIGKHLEKKVDETEDDRIIYNFQQDNPFINVWKELKKAGKENRYIKIYLDRIGQNTASWKKNYKPPVYNFQTLKEKVDSNKFPGMIRSELIDFLSKDEIKKLADALLVEKEEFKIANYLSIFGKIKFPYGRPAILQLAMGKLNRENRIVEKAVEALHFFSAKDIRQFALAKLQKTRTPAIYAELLINNYQKGDGKLLTSIAAKLKNPDLLHTIVGCYILIYRKNKTKECKQPLELIYNKLTCGECRKEIVQILLDNKVLSNKINQEIKNDSYLETRSLKQK